ncbi:MAG: gliding motility-associated C-terminal domain-containing protein [Saprospiraceae bacterium]
MKLLYRLGILFFLGTQPLFGQDLLISTINPDELTVCGTDTVWVHLQNTQGTPVTGIEVTVTLPSGLAYEPGTVSGATEGDISTPNAPQFDLPDINSSGSADLFLLVTASCGLQEAINSGQLFNNQILAEFNGGTEAITSLSYTIETGFLVVVSVTPLTTSGVKGDVIQREIKFRNTRLGPIDRIRLVDEHLLGIDIATPGANQQNNGLVLFDAEFDGSFFTSFGDGDELLEYNEEGTIIEEITITDCGIPSFINPSLIRLSWGCDANVCQYDSAMAEVEILPSPDNPDLEFIFNYTRPLSMCGLYPIYQDIEIINHGNLPATNVTIDLHISDQIRSGFIPGTFEIDYGSGWEPLAPALSNQTTLSECDQIALERSLLNIPLVPENSSVFIRFQTKTCDAICQTSGPFYYGFTFYRLACPTTEIISDSIFNNIDSLDVGGLYSKPRFAINGCFMEGQVEDLSQLFLSPLLTQDTGFLEFVLKLPVGLYWDTTCSNAINGIEPLSVEQTDIGNGKRTVRVLFDLPLPTDSVYMPYCLRYNCMPGMVCEYMNGGGWNPELGGVYDVYPVDCPDSCGLRVEYSAALLQNIDDPTECGLSTCGDYLLFVEDHCNGGGGNGGGGDGNLSALLISYDTYRTNFGFKDDDDDRTVDAMVPPDLNLINRDRYLSGDTMRFDMKGLVIAGPLSAVSFKVFFEAMLSEIFLQDGDEYAMGGGGQQSFVNADSTEFIVAYLTVKKQDGSTNTCQINYSGREHRYLINLLEYNVQPAFTIDRLLSMNHQFDLNLAGCSPDGQPLSVGDSVFFTADFRFKQNYRPLSFAHYPPLINFRNKVWKPSDHFAWTKPVYPGAFSQYSGYYVEQEFPQYSIRPCQTAFEIAPYAYSIRIARENMFPFEVRPIARQIQLDYTIPDDVELLEATATLELQETVPWYLAEPLSWLENGNTMQVNLGPLYQSPIDEGYHFETNFIFDKSCSFFGPDTAIVETAVVYPEGFPGPTIIERFALEELGFFDALPNLELQFPVTTIDQEAPTANIDFILKNKRPAPAPNTWMYIEPLNGNLTDIEVLLMPQQQAYPGVAGLFQLGTIPLLGTLPMRIKARNTNCNQLDVRIIIGWDCEQVSSPESSSCGRDTVLLHLNLLDAVLELNPISQPDDIPLCAPSDWLEFEVSNANQGNGLALRPSIKLPQGISVVLGSTEVSYPSGNGWSPTADPTQLTGNIFQWKLEEILPGLALDGLPGFQAFPLNAFKIRFKVFAECGFVANSQPIYGVEGTQPCGLITNILRKPEDPLGLVGVNESYGVDISLNPIGSDPVYCGELLDIAVQLVVQGTPAASDSIYLLLPSGVSYEAGSYMAGQNAPAGPPEILGQQLQLPLPVTLTPGSVVQFTIQVRYDETAGCIDQFLIAQTRQQTSGFCETTGMFCDVYIATGEALLQLPAQNPELDLISVNPTGQAGGNITLEALVQNAGMVTAPQAVLQLYFDQNNNGTLDATDVLLETFEYNQAFEPGETVVLSGMLTIPVEQLCQVLAVLPALENCACAPLVFPIENWTLDQGLTASCDISPITFGLTEVPGSNYVWQPPGMLSCVNCGTTTFTPDASVMPGDVFLFELLETAGNCTITHLFEVGFGVELTIETPDQTICLGDTVTLAASDGASYEWSGPGITNPGSQTQVVAPQTTTQYTVQITLNDDCMASDTVLVTVNNPVMVELDTMYTCQGVPIDVLGTMTDEAGYYCETYPGSLGCDSTVCVQLSLYPNSGESEAVLCMGDSLFILDTLVTEPGQYCGVLTSSNGCDSTHCVTVNLLPEVMIENGDSVLIAIGDSVQLFAPSGFASYLWEPAAGLSCTDCPSPWASPDSTTVYTVTVGTEDGCSAQATFRVVAWPPCDGRRLKIPNAITPDGDGVNDLFRVVPFEGFEMVASLTVYDRWGEKVYENSGAAEWDATIDGKPAPSDVYVYIVEILCSGNKEKIVGDVTVIR